MVISIKYCRGVKGKYSWKATEFCKQTERSVARAIIRAIIVISKRHFLVSKTQSPSWNGDFASQKSAAPSGYHGWTVWTNDLRLIFSSLGCDETVSKASKLRDQTQKPLTLTLTLTLIPSRGITTVASFKYWTMEFLPADIFVSRCPLQFQADLFTRGFWAFLWLYTPASPLSLKNQ